MLTGQRPFTGTDAFREFDQLALDTPGTARGYPLLPPALSRLTMQLWRSTPDNFAPPTPEAVVGRACENRSRRRGPSAVAVPGHPWAVSTRGGRSSPPARGAPRDAARRFFVPP